MKEKEQESGERLQRTVSDPMGYEPYATAEYYHSKYGGTAIPDEALERMLRQASRHIDSLTYNRIVGRGFSRLSPFQQEVIQETVCRQADFEYENASVLESILASYSVNGVSMGFNGQAWNVFTEKGIAMKRDDYGLLAQTGLTCRLAVRR